MSFSRRDGMPVRITSHGFVTETCGLCGRYARLSIAQWGHMTFPVCVCPNCINMAIKDFGEWKA